MSRMLKPESPSGRLPQSQPLSLDHASLQDLRDRESLRTLIHEFARCIDFRDWTAFEACFTEMVSVQLDPRTAPSPPTAVPAAAWTKVARASFEPYDSTHHLVSVYSISIDGGTARVGSHFQASHYRANPDGAPTFIQKGTYLHACERGEEGGWRISGWEQDVRWGEGNRAVLDRAMDEMPGDLL